MSYLDFYHLSKEPFNVTPDPEFLYLSPSHKEAYGAFVYGITKRKGIIAVIGEVGVGKTTVLRSFLDSLNPNHVRTVYVFNSNLSFPHLIRTIFDDLGIEPKSQDIYEMVNQLHHFLIEEYTQGRNVVVIVDEAQNMPVETLENLRMLSNLETSKDKLIQIVLIGQPELEEKLKKHELRQLDQRIAVRANIFPLRQKESAEYIEHRLTKVRTKSEPVFSDSALRYIVKQSRGVPRTLNILSDNALITGFGYQEKPVTTKIVKEVVTDFRGVRKNNRKEIIAGIVAASIVLAALIWIAAGRLTPSPTPANVVTAPSPASDALRKDNEALNRLFQGREKEWQQMSQKVTEAKTQMDAKTKEVAALQSRLDTLLESQKQQQDQLEALRKQQGPAPRHDVGAVKKLQNQASRLENLRKQEEAKRTMALKDLAAARVRLKNLQKAQEAKKQAAQLEAAAKPPAQSSVSFPSHPTQYAQATPLAQKSETDPGAGITHEEAAPPVSSPALSTEAAQDSATDYKSVISENEIPDDSSKDKPAPTSESSDLQPSSESELHNLAPNEPADVESDAAIKPQIIKTVQPGYPRLAIMKRQEGTVILSVLVSENGNVSAVKVVQNAGGRTGLTEAAISAVEKWKFRPALKDGKRVRVWMTYPITFRLR